MNREARFTEQLLLKDVSKQAGAVDNRAGLEHPLGSLQRPDVSVELTALYLCIELGLRTQHHRLLKVSQRRRPWVNQELARNLCSTQRIESQVRFKCSHPCAVDEADVSDPIVMSLLNDALKLCQIFLAPGHNHGTRFKKWQVHLGVDVQVLLVAILHAAQFKTVARGIETGVQDGAVTFTGTRQNVGAFLQQQHPCAF
ncbi:hypothetical protein D3C76_1048150 [compost metagenome]